MSSPSSLELLQMTAFNNVSRASPIQMSDLYSSSASLGAPHGVATLKVRKGGVDALNKGSGALRKVKLSPPWGVPPEELYYVSCYCHLPLSAGLVSVNCQGGQKLSITAAQEQNRALGPQVYGRYPNLGKHRKIISTIAFARLAGISARGGGRLVSYQLISQWIWRVPASQLVVPSIK